VQFALLQYATSRITDVEQTCPMARSQQAPHRNRAIDSARGKQLRCWKTPTCEIAKGTLRLETPRGNLKRHKRTLQRWPTMTTLRR
jgi:hypothetical protein